MQKLFFAVLSVGLIIVLMAVSAVLVFRTNDLSEMKIKYENSLKSSMEEVFYDMRTLENDLSKLMITVNDKTATHMLSTVQMKSAACGQALSKLPIVATGVQNTLKFTNQLSSYCATVLNNYSSDSFFPENFDTQINDFFATCKKVNGELSKLENSILNNEISLLEVNNGKTESEGIFGSIDNDILEYPSVIFDGPFSDGQERMTPKTDRKEVSEQQATEYVQNIGFSLNFKGEINGIVPAYLFENEHFSAQVTKKGGLLLMAISDRIIENAELSEEEAEEKAVSFAQKLNFGEIKNVWQEYYSNYAVFNFAPVIDGVVIYPDIFKVKVALDNGEIVGFEGKSYIMNNQERQLEKVKVSQEDAKKQLKEGFLVESARLCLISVNEKENLCYEFFGKFNEMTFAVYVSAIDGNEKTSFRILSTETGRMAA